MSQDFETLKRNVLRRRRTLAVISNTAGWLIFAVIVLMGISLWCYSSISEPFEATVFSTWQSTNGGSYVCVRLPDGSMTDISCIPGIMSGCRQGNVVFGTINKRGGYNIIGVRPPKVAKEG